MPSARQTLRTQLRVEVYFCPDEGENPSVCILDLIMSIGYITPQSYIQMNEIRITNVDIKHSLRNLPLLHRVQR